MTIHAKTSSPARGPGRERGARPQPVEPTTSSASSGAGPAPTRAGDRAAKQAFRAGRAHRRRAARHPQAHRRRDHRPQGRARAPPVAREGKTAGRGMARPCEPANLPVLPRRVPAHAGDKSRLGAARRRCRGHPRGGRRRRASSRPGTSRSPSRPGRFAPALAYGTAVVFSPPTWCRHRACAPRDHRARRPPGRGFQPRDGRGHEVGQALLEHPDVNAISFTGWSRPDAGRGSPASCRTR